MKKILISLLFILLCYLTWVSVWISKAPLPLLIAAYYYPYELDVKLIKPPMSPWLIESYFRFLGREKFDSEAKKYGIDIFYLVGVSPNIIEFSAGRRDVEIIKFLQEKNYLDVCKKRDGRNIVEYMSNLGHDLNSIGYSFLIDDIKKCPNEK